MFRLAMPGHGSEDQALEEAARRLSASPAFEVLRRLPAPIERPEAMATVGHGRRLAILLDTETTGLDHRTDVVVEIAMIAVTYCDDGLHDVVGRLEALQDPGRPLDPDVSRLTGLSDDDLAGQRIDVEDLERFLAPVSLVIAHNANFDRSFCEALSPIFTERPWACSLSEVDWKARGVEGRTLGQILRKEGFFHSGHRALTDVYALDRVLRGRDASGRTAFSQMLLRAREPTVEISAVGAPFSARTLLKARGYRWSDGMDGRPRSWWTSVKEICVDLELDWLRSQIADGMKPVTTRRTAHDRFRSHVEARNGKK